MLAKLHGEAFDNDDYLFEIKWDGYRAIAEINGNETRLYSRNGLSFADEYPTVFNELQKIKHKAILDGEIVALDEEGIPSFQLLQQYGQSPDVPLIYYVFDLLSLDGKSTEDLPLTDRKELLQQLLPESDVISYCDHVKGQGKDFFKAMQQKGLEGMIAKPANGTYTEGSRNGGWLKIKHMLTDEAVIAGFTQPRGSRKYFGALILGHYEKNKLVYIGHTGTGFDQKTLKATYNKLQPLVTDTNPFGEKIKVNAPVTWVKPQLVCSLKYTEVTAAGNRRHPVFMGLRKDKAAKEVHTETPIAKDKKEPLTTNNDKMDTKKKIGGKQLSLTNLDKVFWPDEGYTKGDVIDYYNNIYKYIIPYLKGRPESLKRNPNGIKGKAFYHKDAGENAPEWIDTYPTWSESAEKTIDYIVCNNKPTLLYLANLGCIEMNPWNSRITKPENPDYLVLDLDPSAKNTFDEVVDCAKVIKEILDKAGADSYCKTSGSTGLHIYVPLNAKYDYEQARQFAQIVAQMTNAQLPETTTIERSLSKRKKHHIYIDYLQNKRGQTLSSPYSLRPKPGAPVSTPLNWKEVKHGLDMYRFNIKTIAKRIERKGDLFAPVLKKGIDMMKALKKIDTL